MSDKDLESGACARVDCVEPPKTVEERVQACIELMHANEWVRGKTGKQKAVEWGCSLSAVENASAEAARRYYAGADADKLRGKVGETHMRMLEVSSRRYIEDESVDDGRIAIAAGDSLVRMVRDAKPLQVEIAARAPEDIRTRIGRVLLELDAVAPELNDDDIACVRASLATAGEEGNSWLRRS